MTFDEFVAWEPEQEQRHELVAGRVSLMPGVTVAHSRIETSVVATFRAHLRGGPCDVHGGQIMLETRTGIRYADAVVTCDERDRDPGARVLRHPKLIVEVLSKSSASVDRGAKVDEYCALASLEQYLLIDSRKRWACTYLRDGDAWLASVPISGGSLRLPSLGFSLGLDEVFAEAGIAPD